MHYFFYYLSIFCIVSTLIPFLKISHWTVRMFDFPLVQLSVMTLLALVGNLFFLELPTLQYYTLELSLLAAFIYQVVVILPYTPLYRKEVQSVKQPDPKNAIKILSSNVLIENRTTKKLAAQIEALKPDVVLLLEPDQWWKEQIAPVVRAYPYRVEHPLDNAYGILLYSKYELITPSLTFIIKKDIPSIHTDVALPSGKKIRLFCMHPEPPTPQENPKSDERDAELLHLGKNIIDKSQPTIVIGDLNDVAWSATTRLFRKVSELLDPRIGRGAFTTFHADYRLLRWPLDHVFHSEHFKLVNMQKLPHIGSDHFPIYIHLEYQSNAAQDQDTPTADADDREEAQAKIDNVKQ